MIILIVIFYLFSKFLFFGHAAILAAFFVFSLVNLLTGTAAIRVTFFELWVMAYWVACVILPSNTKQHKLRIGKAD